LKRKTTSLSEAEKGQVELRKALEAKDAELAKKRAELEVERRKRTDVDKLREELREAQADVRSLQRRNGVLRGDVDTAWQNEKRMSDAFEMLNAEMRKSKDTWKRILSCLVADVERAREENVRLTQAMASRNAKTKKLTQEREAAVRRHRQAQGELGPLRLELSVAVKDLKKARANQDAQQRDIDRIMGKLGKTSIVAQANLKKIVEKFREQMNATI
jgi:chromosome segregation ATPase